MLVILILIVFHHLPCSKYMQSEANLTKVLITAKSCSRVQEAQNKALYSRPDFNRVLGRAWETTGRREGESIERHQPAQLETWCRCCRLVTRSCVIFATPGPTACPTPLSFTISQNLFIFMSTESMMLSKLLILRCPLLVLPSVFPSIRVFSNESNMIINMIKVQVPIWELGD